MAEPRALSEVGEHAFLRALCADLRERRAGRGREERSLLVEPGDDCAVLAPSPYPLALTTDSLVEGVHFRPEWLTSAELGRRAAMVSLSDLAAMGAEPRRWRDRVVETDGFLWPARADRCDQSRMLVAR